jgi:hypothetical protein
MKVKWGVESSGWVRRRSGEEGVEAIGENGGLDVDSPDLRAMWAGEAVGEEGRGVLLSGGPEQAAGAAAGTAHARGAASSGCSARALERPRPRLGRLAEKGEGVCIGFSLFEREIRLHLFLNDFGG